MPRGLWVSSAAQNQAASVQFVGGLDFFGAEGDERWTIFVTDGGCRRPLCFASGPQEMLDTSNPSALSRQHADFRRLSRCLLCRPLFDPALSRRLWKSAESSHCNGAICYRPSLRIAAFDDFSILYENSTHRAKNPAALRLPACRATFISESGPDVTQQNRPNKSDVRLRGLHTTRIPLMIVLARLRFVRGALIEQRTGNDTSHWRDRWHRPSSRRALGGRWILTHSCGSQRRQATGARL